MRRNRAWIDRMEGTMREVFLLQPTVLPSEAWHAAVLARIRAEAIGAPPIPFVSVDRIAWWGAILAAAAAVIVSILGYARMPTEGQLAWEWSESGSAMEWLSQAGG